MNIVCIVAHIDDMELSAGNLIQDYGERGRQVDILVCAGQDNSVRYAEAMQAAKVLGVENYHVRNLPDGRFAEHASTLQQRLEEYIRTRQIDTVMTHFPHDIHQDHRVVTQAVHVACRHIPNLIYLQSPGTQHFTPNYFHVASLAHQQRKQDALRCFASQHNVGQTLHLLQAHAKSLALSYLPPHYLLALQQKRGEDIYFEPFHIARHTTISTSLSTSNKLLTKNVK